MAIVGWIILGVLVLILVFGLLVLYFPISYRIQGKKSPLDMSAHVKIKWLFGFVRVLFDYPKPGKPVGKILFFTVGEKRQKRQKKKKKADEQPQTEEKSSQGSDPGQNNAEMSAATSEDFAKETIPEEQTIVQSTHESQDSEAGHRPEINTGKKSKKRVKSRTEKRSLIDRLNFFKKECEFYRKLWIHENTQALLKEAFGRISLVFRNVVPRKIRGIIHFGAGTPDITAFVYGVYCAGKTLFPKKLEAEFEPDFENVILEGEFEIKGHFMLITVLWNAARLFFDKRLKWIRGKLDRHKESLG